MPSKLHTEYIKALQNKDMRSPGLFLFIKLYHGFMSYFLLLLERKSLSSSLWVFNDCVTLCPGEEV